MIKLGRVFQTLAAVLLLLLALSPLVFIAQQAAAAFRTNAEEIAARGELYDKLRAIAAFHKSAPVQTTDAGELPAILLGDGTPAVLSAGLQAKLREMASGLGVDIIQVGELQPKIIASFQQIGVRVEMSGPFMGVHQLLQQVGANTPWLFTGNVQLRSGVEQGLASATEPPLYLALDIWGLAAAETVATATP